MCSVLSFLTSPHTPSQLKQLRQQLATTQRLLDSYDTRGTAGDLQKLAAAANHGRGCGRSQHGRGDFVTYGRTSRARPGAAARGAGTPAAASVSAAAGSRAGIYVDIGYES